MVFKPILALHNYEFFKLSKLLGGGGAKRYVCHHIGGRLPPAHPPPPESTRRLCRYQEWLPYNDKKIATCLSITIECIKRLGDMLPNTCIIPKASDCSVVGSRHRAPPPPPPSPSRRGGERGADNDTVWSLRTTPIWFTTECCVKS